MPRLISQVNSAGAIGISSDGTDQGNVTKINFEIQQVVLLNQLPFFVL